MGFPLVCYCVAVPKPVVALLKLVACITQALQMMLSFVGLYRFPHDHSPHRHSVVDGDVPLPETVKESLPAVEFRELSAAEAEAPAPALAPTTCIVCLEWLEAKDKVRRLGNCAHAFHAGCIDRWIDLGRVTCPLCRAHLLPRKRWGPPVWAHLGAGLRTRVW